MSDKPTYVRSGKVIDDIRQIAREHGYAIAVHGSLRAESDIDLLAVPWVKDAHAPRTLMRAINRLPISSASSSTTRIRRNLMAASAGSGSSPTATAPAATTFDMSVMPRAR